MERRVLSLGLVLLVSAGCKPSVSAVIAERRVDVHANLDRATP